MTLATGHHQRLLEIAMPSFQRFADLHGYDIVTPKLDCSRPPSWWKVPALKAALTEYDEALWVDADIVIVDPSRDMQIPDDAWQALVAHRTGDGLVPNCAVWYVRQPMTVWLDRVWQATHRIDHGWWEQAAMLDLLGFQHHYRPAYLSSPTVLYEHTFWLDNGWNVHMWDVPGPARPRFMHATMHDDREAVMRRWAAGEVPEVPDTECRHMYRVDICPACKSHFDRQQVAA